MYRVTKPRRALSQVLGLFLIGTQLGLLTWAGNVYPTLGKIQRLDPRLDELLPADAKLEVLSSGYEWSEGPVWDSKENCLLFSDVPVNRIYKWSEESGTSIYMEPSGYTGLKNPDYNQGSNGLTMNAEGKLVICEGGDRRVAVLEPNGGKRTIADAYDGKRFNSPNDLDIDSDGNIYMTDPSYGMRLGWDTPERELDIAGVYLIRPSGDVELLTDELKWPNGVALSPEEDFLYVAQSWDKAPYIMRYPINEDKSLGKGIVFYDFSKTPPPNKRQADGLKIDRDGNIWTTGPGGLLIISKEGDLLGRILTGQDTGNCCWGEDGSVLYVTADYYICRIQTKTIGKGF